jgi:S1-C subfamily serine protease
MAQTLAELSAALADTVAALGASTVRVEARERVPATGIVWSADGAIVTAHHVVEEEESIRVGLADGRTVPAKLAGRDPTTDLAVLRAEASGLAVPGWADASAARVGNLLLALGRPGHSVMAAFGIISALGEGWRTPAGGQIDHYLQPDIVMYPGFSGGPLVDAGGQVLGMMTSGLLRGMAAAVPADTVRRVTELLLTQGRVRRGYLGIGTQPVRLPDPLAQQVGQEVGLLLLSVEPGSPADRGGLVLGDTIVALDGHPIRHLDDLQAQLAGDRVGSQATIRILRGGKVEDRSIVIGERA